jgi:AraC-like DNA-binding protein
MNRLQTYVDSTLLTLSRFDHPAGEPHVDPREETASDYSVNFLERGSYTLRVGRRRWHMSPGVVFITTPGMIFRCGHEEAFPQDVAFSVSYKQDFAAELFPADKFEAWPLPPASPLNNRLAYLYLRLSRVAAEGGDVMAAETLGGELCAAVTDGARRGSHKLYQRRQLAWYAERVEAARALLEAESTASHTLASLARSAGMSPFHFARVFRELTGTPPHRYLLKVRLARASERLRGGASVTETCFATGFANLSHFTRLFRRTFGVSPSRFAGKRESEAPARPAR